MTRSSGSKRGWKRNLLAAACALLVSLQGCGPANDRGNPQTNGGGANGGGANGGGANGGGANGGGQAGNGTSDPRPAPKDPSEYEGKPLEELVAALGDDTNWELASGELKRHGAEAVSRLREALADPSPDVRRRAAFCLGTLGPAAKEAVADLRKLAETEEDRTVSDTAAFAADAIEE